MSKLRGESKNIGQGKLFETKESRHPCVLCNTVLDSKEALQDHFRKHANKEIDLKGRTLGPEGELKQTTKNGVYIRGSGSQVNTKIKCDVCGEEFNCNTRAIQHKFRKHPFDAVKHYCPQCGMQFPLQGHRDNHLKEQHESDHVPKNPYPCYQCGAIFFNKAAHEYHDKSAHHRVVTLYKQIQTPPPSKKIRYNNAGEPQSVYYCHLCGLEYIVKFNLQKHLERQHPIEERAMQPAELFKCNTCDALFYNQKAYLNHNNYHRPNDLYVTSEEQRLQTVTRVDQDFDIRRVQPAAERYIPRFRRRRISVTPSSKFIVNKTSKEKEDEEMSPPPNSDSDSDQEDGSVKNETNYEKKEVTSNSKEIERTSQEVDDKQNANEMPEIKKENSVQRVL
ncbi:zinc finger protein 260 [Halyomorpha halys]|uniref:zinc finger protein 260 n=1 Tax=Halyomorpha halys TaxID=286706 RepID=UPI0006D50F7F|nr:zinc finger protein 845 [Halyomorpha halys]